MDTTILLEPNLIEINVDVESKEEIISRLANLLMQNSYVRETYIPSVLKREEVFPTGLQTKTIGVAIPHTDAEHVLRPGIAIATLKNAVKFNLMGDSENETDVKLVFMLAIDNPRMQLNLLRNIVNIIQNENLITRLMDEKDRAELFSLVEPYLNNV
jgi:galactitol PTS system EIIA component